MISTIQLIRLLTAIAVVESGTDDLARGAHGEFGRYQMTPEAFRDTTGRKWDSTFQIDFVTAMQNPERAQWAALLYLHKYTDSDRHPFGGYSAGPWRSTTLEDAARIWNGGPDGWRKDSTIAYWHKVKAVYDQQSFLQSISVSKSSELDRHDIIAPCPPLQSLSSAELSVSTPVTIDGSSSKSDPATPFHFDLNASEGKVHFSIPSPCTIRLNVGKPATSPASPSSR